MRFLILLSLLFPFAIQANNIQAAAYLVVDEDGQVLLSKNENDVRSIASISKLFVAEQVYDELHPDNVVSITKEDYVSHSARVRPNMQLTEQQLLELSLISSSNQATYALARTHDYNDTIAKINESLQQREFKTIRIVEPSGLSAQNKASAVDLVKYMMQLQYSPVADISVAERTSFGNYRSTNPFIGKPGWDFFISKTGFIRAAGGCLAAALNIGGRSVYVVILGSPNMATRWNDLVKIRKALFPEDVFWTAPAPKKSAVKKRNVKKRSKNKKRR